MGLDSPMIVRLLMAERERLFSYIWAIIGDVHLAEDVFQEVSLLAVEKGGEVTGEACKRLGRDVSPYELEHMTLVDSIRKNQKRNDGWHGATSSFTAVLGRMATYSGQLVKWDEAVAKGPDEMPKRFAFDADPPVLPDKDGRYPIPIPGVYKPY